MRVITNVNEVVELMSQEIDIESLSSTLVADFDYIYKTLKKFLTYDNVELTYCDVDTFEYDREYGLTLHLDICRNVWEIDVWQTYNEDKNMYYGMDGFVIYHEDVNSKCMLDMLNNKTLRPSRTEWIVIANSPHLTR